MNNKNVDKFLGVAGVAGNMVAQSMCLPPLYCTTTSLKCCLIRPNRFGVPTCPDTCPDIMNE